MIPSPGSHILFRFSKNKIVDSIQIGTDFPIIKLTLRWYPLISRLDSVPRSGRVASILEMGGGFGRKNICLYEAGMGMSPREIGREYRGISELRETEKIRGYN
jgi:hypothetical protein